MQNIAQRMNVSAEQIENFIRESPWDHENLQRHIRRNVPKSIHSKMGAIIIDDVPIVKKGKHSVGTQRQYCGVTGGINNCQSAVDLTYVVPDKKRNANQKTWQLGMELYLPESWTNDQDRRKEAGIPNSVEFRTKPEIAIDMLDQVLNENIEFLCVVADPGYGDSRPFRKSLRDRKIQYIVGVTPKEIRVIDAEVEVSPHGVKDYQIYPQGTKVKSAIQMYLMR